MKAIITLSGLLLVLAPLQATPPARPNVLIVMCDQLNAGVLSCYGGPVPTPHIDRIAREGVLFDGAVCTWPVCSPSRASFVTGRYPHAHGILWNVNRRDYPVIPSPPAEEGIKVADVTTEKLLHAAGYATHHYGKWHLLDDDLPYYGDMYGEHHAYAAEMAAEFAQVRKRERDAWMDWYGWALPTTRSPAFQRAVSAVKDRWERQTYGEYITKMGRLDLPLADSFDVRTADRTVERIEALGGRPFMLTCSFNVPHDPNVAAMPYYGMFDPARVALPANRAALDARFQGDWSRQIVAETGEPGLREFLRIYYALVKLLDDQVGRLLAALETTGQLDRTIIVFTTDHGDMAGGHGMVWKSTSAFYDEIARVPLLIRYPPVFQPQRCGLAADLTDVMPTLLELTGQPIPAEAQGQSFVPFLTGRKAPAQARAYSFSERMRGSPEHRRGLGSGAKGSFMVRGQGWKYVIYEDGTEFLYHLADDPGETVNVASDPKARERKADMIATLQAWQRRTGWPGARSSAEASPH